MESAALFSVSGSWGANKNAEICGLKSATPMQTKVCAPLKDITVIFFDQIQKLRNIYLHSSFVNLHFLDITRYIRTYSLQSLYNVTDSAFHKILHHTCCRTLWIFYNFFDGFLHF